MHQIPWDNQIRHLLTPPNGQVNPVSFLFQALHQAGVVEIYRSVNQTLLLAFDRVQIFLVRDSLPAVSVRQHTNGSVTNSHTAVTPVLVKPGLDKVIPLAPNRPPRRRGEARLRTQRRQALAGRLGQRL